MAVPKRRVSKTRAAKRRTHYSVKLPIPVKDKDGSWKYHTAQIKQPANTNDKDSSRCYGWGFWL